jgi:hypothetical protein
MATGTTMIRGHVDTAPAGSIRCLSLCAGECRDLTDALAAHPRAQDLTGAIVELDPVLAVRATTRIAATHLRLQVVVGDAGATDEFGAWCPVDLLLLVGIFGNISDRDVERTIRNIPRLCTLNATVIWTRHRRDPDLTPSILRWLSDAGCETTAFESAGPGGHSVGSCRVRQPDPTVTLPRSLFSFSDLW